MIDNCADSSTVASLGITPPHPLDQLSKDEIEFARNVILQERLPASVIFRNITLEEPPKSQLLPYLLAERNGELSHESVRPPRLARVVYDTITSDRARELCDSVVNVETREETSFDVIDKQFHAPFILAEIEDTVTIVKESPIFQELLNSLCLPDNDMVVIEPWMYGGCNSPGEPRYIQALVYAKDPVTKHPDSNIFAFPLPMIVVVDLDLREVARIEKLCTGGAEDGLKTDTHPKEVIGHCEPGEYIPELLIGGVRQDLKPLNVHQPNGASFHVTGNLVEWQKWRFRVGFNAREGATLHDISYEGRSIFYRISFSELSVPYGDPRPPYQRKQAFDFGDGGGGRAANSLELGCDCLGVVKYFDGVLSTQEGTGYIVPKAICMHEQDNGIGWKHKIDRTRRTIVTRNRLLIIQFILTMGNYEYIFAYHFDQAGGLTIETRATGIVSTVPIDPGKTVPWGNVVHPGVLAQNHQHIFCVRIDPCIDGPQNTVLYEESHVLPWDEETNPYGVGFGVRQTVFEKSGWADAAPHHNRVFKIINPNHRNPISGKPVGYKFAPSPTQLILAPPDSIMGRRAAFAQHHVWITKYRDNEYWGAGRWTNQSYREIGGVKDMVDRNEDTVNEDIVVWLSFGMTHTPRVEDFPVMPVDIHAIHLKPADFFTRNPAIDVPSTRNETSQYYPEDLAGAECCK